MSQGSFITIPIDIGAPENLWWPITPAAMPAGVPPLDMTSVSGVTYNVRCNDTGFVATFTGGIYSSVTTAGYLLATYAFTGSDFPAAGYYVLRPVLAVPGGTVKCNTGVIQVVQPT